MNLLEQRELSLLTDTGLEARHLCKILLKPRHLIEWGAPYGTRARQAILQIVSLSPSISQLTPCLWSYSRSDVTPYIPQWATYGLPQNSLFFVNSECPQKDLRPALLSHAFKMIVLDAPKGLTQSDLSFLKQLCCRYEYCLMLLRPYLLSSKNGNPFANFRVNIYPPKKFSQNWRVHLIKGHMQKNSSKPTELRFTAALGKGCTS